MEFRKVIEKHGYSEELGNFLKQIYDEFVLEFGLENEKVIFMSFYEVPIISVSNIYDGMIENELYEQIDGVAVTEGDLRRASGCYTSKAKELNTNGVYSIDKINRAVLISNLDLRKDWHKGVLIHELGHLVKSYMNEYTINGDLKINRSGLQETIAKIEKDGEYILVSEKGVGLEEGLNTVLEEKVTRKLVDPNYEISGYGVSCALAKKFLELCDNEILNKAQLYGLKDELITSFNQKYGDAAYERFESIADKIYKTALEMYSSLDTDKIHESSKKLKEIINNEYWPLIDEFEDLEKNSGGRNA